LALLGLVEPDDLTVPAPQHRTPACGAHEANASVTALAWWTQVR
jgi:hypothetical protein